MTASLITASAESRYRDARQAPRDAGPTGRILWFPVPTGNTTACRSPATRDAGRLSGDDDLAMTEGRPRNRYGSARERLRAQDDAGAAAFADRPLGRSSRDRWDALAAGVVFCLIGGWLGDR